MPDLQTIDATQLGGVGDLTRRIFDGDSPGVVVRGVLSPELCARTVAVLEAGSAPAQPMGGYPGTTFGEVLVTAEDLGPYFEAARALEKGLPPEVLPAITRAHRGLLPGYKIGVPRSKSGDFYAAVTVRKLSEGQAIAVHSERANWPSMAGLRASLDLSTQVSFYVLLQAAEEGGRLVLGDAGHDQACTDMVEQGVGDMVVFDGGRHNHLVTEVRGPTPRWTIGGFSAFARDRFYFWS